MSGLKCEDCGSRDFRTLETRSPQQIKHYIKEVTDMNVVYRIKECQQCKERFLTKEEIISKRRSL